MQKQQPTLYRFFTVQKKESTHEIKHIDTLLEDERTKSIHKDKDNNFVLKGKKYGGITKPLRKKFYRHHDENSMRSKYSNSNREKGTLVHRHVYHAVHCVTINRCECTIKTPTRKINKFAKQALDTMKAYNITPIDSEVPIISNKMNLGTSIDVVGMINNPHDNTKSRPVIISLKTGYRNTMNTKTFENMSSPVSHLDNSPYNHHQLQGLVERYILKKEYNMQIDDYFIFYLGNEIGTNECKPYKLESWCFDDKLCDKIFEKMHVNVS